MWEAAESRRRPTWPKLGRMAAWPKSGGGGGVAGVRCGCKQSEGGCRVLAENADPRHQGQGGWAERGVETALRVPTGKVPVFICPYGRPDFLSAHFQGHECGDVMS